MERLLGLIEQVIVETKPKQLLHIPFARVVATEPEWEGDWFHRHIHLGSEIEYLNAMHEADIQKTKNPMIFLSGGGNNTNLLNTIKSDKRLFELVMHADFLIGESAGAKILGEFFRENSRNIDSAMLPGLGILKNTVMEAHYSQHQRQELLKKDMIDTGVKYGLGLDSFTGIIFELNDFPNNIIKIGEGLYEIKRKE
jgi:peptidase E